MGVQKACNLAISLGAVTAEKKKRASSRYKPGSRPSRWKVSQQKMFELGIRHGQQMGKIGQQSGSYSQQSSLCERGSLCEQGSCGSQQSSISGQQHVDCGQQNNAFSQQRGSVGQQDCNCKQQGASLAEPPDDPREVGQQITSPARQSLRCLLSAAEQTIAAQHAEMELMMKRLQALEAQAITMPAEHQALLKERDEKIGQLQLRLHHAMDTRDWA